jgi:hypothetical protein
MITNSEEANKYYQLVNQYIDEYTETHKIKPSKLGNYLKNNQKLVRFIERKGLKDIKNINQVISDVVSDRIAMEKDLVRTFESFKLFESEEFKILNLRQCLYKGVDKSNIHHEKILADYFDVSLSHIDIIDSDKHIFKIETLNSDIECVIYNQNELEIIKENMKEYCFEQVFNKKIKLEGVGIELNVNIKDFIDSEKFNNHINDILTIDKVKEIIRILLSCDKPGYNPDEKDNFIGINPSHY